MIYIKTIVVTPLAQNSRLIFDEEKSEGVVVDPGGEIEKIFGAIKKTNVKNWSVILTHSHVDHAAGVMNMIDELGEISDRQVFLYAHSAEKFMRENIVTQALAYGLEGVRMVREPDVYLQERDEIKVGNSTLRVIFTPGHSPGHLSFFVDKGPFDLLEEGKSQTHSNPFLIAGDTLFAGSIGRTDLPGGNHSELISSIKTKFYVLPDETIVLSGHGPKTTIGIEKQTNPFVRA